jgi:uncharacterized protein RhaS with RHS repeats
MYDAAVARWMCIDPLANKYYSLSPYNYVANNPLLYVDPDGKKIRFAPGSSNKFKTQFASAVKYLNKNGAGGLLASLESSKSTYYIAERTGGSSFNRKTKTIKWNPTMGVITNEGHILSPATVLNHEADHANQYDKKPEQFKKDIKKGSDKQYDTKEEKRVITGSEQETAKKNGEIKEGEVTRKDHQGTPWETKSPITTKGKYEVTVTAKEKKDE